MDNELHYLSYDPEEIWEEMTDAYRDAGGDVLYPGDEKEMLLRSVMAVVVQVFAGVDNALRMQTLRYAAGEYLDLIGEQRNCPRIQASPAKTSVLILGRANGRPSVLPKGTAMTADGANFYLLEEAVTLSGFTQSLNAEITAERPGSAGNALLAGTELQLAINNAGVESITVNADAAGGNEKEDDDVYRERIREFWLTAVTTGPARQYEAAAKRVSSAIVDARALRTGAGQVGVYLILSTSTGASAIVQAVQAALSAEELRPLTDSVTVSVAEYETYVLSVQYQANAGSTTTAAIAAAVQEYKDWQENTIGRAFNPDRLMAGLYQAGCTRVVWGEGSRFGDDGEVAYTEIDPEKYCKGSVTLTAMNE